MSPAETDDLGGSALGVDFEEIEGEGNLDEEESGIKMTFTHYKMIKIGRFFKRKIPA